MDKALTTVPRQQSKRQASTAPYKVQQNKQRQIKQNPQPKKSRRAKRQAAAGTHISGCGLQYASALADPVNTPVGACVPFGFPLPSQKIKTFARGTFALGTTGFGFCTVKPPLANDTNAISATTSTSVGGAGTPLNSFTNLGNFQVTKLPYTSVQMVDNQQPVEGRMVASELRIRYAGTEMNRNGIVTTLEEPDHRHLNNLSPSGVVAYTPSLNERPPPDGSWHSVKWSGPVASTELDYVAAAVFSSNNSMGFVVQGIAGDLYEWEYYIHNEYTGTKVNGMTPSHTDATAYGKVVETFKAITSNGPLNNDSAPSAFMDFIKSAGSSIGSVILDYGVPALAGLISPALVPAARLGTKMLTGK